MKISSIYIYNMSIFVGNEWVNEIGEISVLKLSLSSANVIKIDYLLFFILSVKLFLDYNPIKNCTRSKDINTSSRNNVTVKLYLRRNKTFSKEKGKRRNKLNFKEKFK